MTREEAIKQLDTMWKMLTSAYDDIADSHVAAYTMAVDALKAQTDGDTISRQDAIDAILAVTGNSSVRELYEHVQEHGLSEMWSGGVSAAIDVIIAVPSAQPEHFADVGNMDDGELDFVQKHEKIPVELRVSAQPKPCEDAVSRQTLQKELALYPIDDITSEDEAGYNRAINDVQKMVLHLPSAQPEIIRCKDCKYWREHKYAKETKRYIPFCGFNAIYTKADDFCSRAERRTDE